MSDRPGAQRNWWKFIPGGIRARLFFLIALVLLPMIFLLVSVYAERYQTRVFQALQTEMEVAQGVASTFSTYLEDVRRSSYAVGEGILAFERYTTAKVTHVLRVVAGQYQTMRNLSWVGPDGVVLASSQPDFVGVDLSDRAYFREVVAGRAWAVGDLTRRGKVSEAPTFAIATAVRSAVGELRGVVVAGIAPEQLGELTLTQQRPAGGAYAIFDRQGTLVYRNLGPLSWEDRNRWRDTDPLLDRALKSGEAQAGRVRLAIPGGEWFSARVPIPEFGWVVGAGRPVQEALAPVRERLIYDAALAAMIASVAFLLAWALARNIARPLQRLAADVGMLGKGYHILREEDSRAPDEVHRVRASVTAMAEDLQRRADELRRSEERYRLVSFATSDVIWDWNLVTGELFWNQALETVFGYRLAEVPAEITWWYEHLHPDDGERVVAGLHSVIDGDGSTWTDEYRFRRADGAYATVLDRGFIQRDEQGKPQRMVGSILDLTEQKRAEEALRASEAKFRAVFEQAAVGMGRVAFTDARWIDVNDAFCRMLGYSAAEMRATPWPQMTHPEDVHLDQVPFRRMAAGELDGYTVEKRFIHKEGHHVWARLSLSLVRDDEGRPDYEIAIIENITERRLAEEELRRLTEQLEERVQERTAALTAANRELEAFTYTVSHDLRAPLRHIGGFIELLRNRVGACLDEQGRKYLQIIDEAGQRMGLLIEDLLTFSRIGRAPVKKTAVDLRELTEEVRRELAPESAGRRIDWRIGDLPPVHADPVLLRTVVSNLLANAIKYTRDREPAVIELGCREEPEETVCFVRDNGAGFDMRYADKLFGVFQRLHPAQQFEGTGIGLASAQRIVQRHGGRTWAEGKVGKGATFYFSLPRKGDAP